MAYLLTINRYTDHPKSLGDSNLLVYYKNT